MRWKLNLIVNMSLFVFGMLIVIWSISYEDPMSLGMGIFFLWAWLFWEMLMMKEDIKKLKERENANTKP